MFEWTELTLMLRGGAIGLVLLVVILLARDHRHANAGRITILFMLAVIGHIVATSNITLTWPTPGLWVAEIAGTAAPPLFWLLARGHTKLYSKVLAVAAIWQLFSSIGFAAIYGAHGLILAFIFAELLRLAGTAFAIRSLRNGTT